MFISWLVSCSKGLRTTIEKKFLRLRINCETDLSFTNFTHYSIVVLE